MFVEFLSSVLYGSFFVKVENQTKFTIRFQVFSFFLFNLEIEEEIGEEMKKKNLEYKASNIFGPKVKPYFGWSNN